MFLLNKKNFSGIFSVLLFLSICSCKTSSDLIQISNDALTLPASGIINTEKESFFRKDNKTFLLLSKDCILEIDKEEYKLKQGTLLETIPSSKSKIKKIKYQTLFQSQTGSFSFFRILIPKIFFVEEMTFVVKYLNGEKLQDSKKGCVYSYYENSSENFYGIFLPFSPLYEQERYLLSVDVHFRDGEKMTIYSTGLIEKKTFKEQTLNFPKKKSKDLVSASRKKYNTQQAFRHELWRTVTPPLSKDILQITKPLDNTSRVTSDFCFTRRWVLNNGELYSKDVHLGVDYGVPTGSLIYSLLDGVVVLSGLQELYGNMVIVNHGLGLYTNYCHMDKCLKKSDTLIKKGEALGKVGMTGAATGPHLHMEARIYGIPIDYRKLECLPELFTVEP